LFAVIPAIDLLDRQVVRVEQGDPSRKKVYSEDPESTFAYFLKNGARIIHLVDLNSAIKGDSNTNASVVDSILAEFGQKVTVQVAGGIRSVQQAKSLVERGAKRIVIGSLVYSNLDAALRILKIYKKSSTSPFSVVVALDYDRAGYVRTSGWKNRQKEKVDSALARFTRLGFSSVLLTAIRKDGMMDGPDTQKLREIRYNFSRGELKIIASGGVTTETDIDKLFSIGVDEVIVGKAFYEGKIPLSALTRFASK